MCTSLWIKVRYVLWFINYATVVESLLYEHRDILVSTKEKKKASLFHPLLNVVRKRDHAHRLPDTETDARSDTTVETSDAVLFVNEGKSVENRQFCRSVRVGSGL